MAHQVFDLDADEYLVGGVSQRWLKDPRPLIDAALVPPGEIRYLDLVVARRENDRGGVFHFEEVTTGTRTNGHDLSTQVESAGVFRLAVGDTYFDFPVADDSGGDEPYAIDFSGATQTAYNAWRDANLSTTSGETAASFTIWDGAGTNPYTPVLQSVETNGAGTVVTLTYNWGLDTGSVPAVGDFTLSPTKTITGVVVSGRTVALTVSAAFTDSDTIIIDYAPGTNRIKGTTGYEAEGANWSVTNSVDTTAPTLQSAETNEAGNEILLTFSEALDDAHVPPITTLPVTVAGAARALADSGVTISDEIVTLALSAPVDQGEAVTVAYAQPSVASTRLQDETGNEVATFAAQAVTNRVPVNTDLFEIVLTDIWNSGAEEKWWRETDGVPADVLVQDTAATMNLYAYNFDPPSPLRTVLIEVPRFSEAIERDAGEFVIEKTDGTKLLEFDFPTYTTGSVDGYQAPDQTDATMAAFIAYAGDLVVRITQGAAPADPLGIKLALGKPQYTGFDIDALNIALSIGGTPQSCYVGTLSGNGFVFLGPADFPFTPNTSQVVLVPNSGSTTLRLAFETSSISQALDADFVGAASFQVRAPDGTVLFASDFTADMTALNYDIPYTAAERDAIRALLNSTVTIEFFKPGPAPFHVGADAQSLGMALALGTPEAREGAASDLQIGLSLGGTGGAFTGSRHPLPKTAEEQFQETAHSFAAANTTGSTAARIFLQLVSGLVLLFFDNDLRTGSAFTNYVALDPDYLADLITVRITATDDGTLLHESAATTGVQRSSGGYQFGTYDDAKRLAFNAETNGVTVEFVLRDMPGPLVIVRTLPTPLGIGLALSDADLQYRNLYALGLQPQVAIPDVLGDVTALPEAWGARLAVAQANLEYRNALPLDLGIGLELERPFGPYLSVPPLGMGLAPGEPIIPVRTLPTPLGAGLGFGMPQGYSLSILGEAHPLNIDLALAEAIGSGLVAPRALGMGLGLGGPIIPVRTLPEGLPIGASLGKAWGYSFAIPLEPHRLRVTLFIDALVKSLERFYLNPVNIGLRLHDAAHVPARLGMAYPLPMRLYMARPDIAARSGDPNTLRVAVHLRSGFGASSGITWPADLPQGMLERGFESRLSDSLRISPVEQDGPRTSRMYTEGIDEISGRMLMTEAEYDRFFTFYDQNLRGGTRRFLMPVPLTDELGLVEFTEPPVRVRSGINWEVSISLRWVG